MAQWGGILNDVGHEVLAIYACPFCAHQWSTTDHVIYIESIRPLTPVSPELLEQVHQETMKDIETPQIETPQEEEQR